MLNRCLLGKKYELEINGDRNIYEVEVPYIPGSSIKGRMRCLLELYEGAELYFDGKIHMHVRDLNRENTCRDPEHALDNLFGSPSFQVKSPQKDKDIVEKIAPTRLIVEDVFPSPEYVKKLYRRYGTVGMEEFLEEKPENRIDRITSAAEPRFILRVKPDVEFAGRITLLLFNIDHRNNKIKEYLNLIFTGLKLIEDTYLGGSGTRGYGKVVFKDISIVLRTPKYYESGVGEEVIVDKASSVVDLLKKIDDIVTKIKSKISENIEQHH